MWHLTELELPEQTGIYVVTCGSEKNRWVTVRAFIKSLDDWDSYANPEEYTEEVYEDGEYRRKQIEFPVWYTMRGWENEDVYPDTFYYDLEDAPYAWMEMPKPCNGEEDVCAPEECGPTEFEFDLSKLII